MQRIPNKTHFYIFSIFLCAFCGFLHSSPSILPFHSSDRKWQTVPITKNGKNQYSIDVYSNLFVRFFYPASVILWFVECINNWRGEYVSAHQKNAWRMYSKQMYTNVLTKNNQWRTIINYLKLVQQPIFSVVRRERVKCWSAFGILYCVIIAVIVCFFVLCTSSGTWQ